MSGEPSHKTGNTVSWMQSAFLKQWWLCLGRRKFVTWYKTEFHEQLQKRLWQWWATGRKIRSLCLYFSCGRQCCIQQSAQPGMRNSMPIPHPWWGLQVARCRMCTICKPVCRIDSQLWCIWSAFNQWLLFWIKLRSFEGFIFTFRRTAPEDVTHHFRVMRCLHI